MAGNIKWPLNSERKGKNTEMEVIWTPLQIPIKYFAV